MSQAAVTMEPRLVDCSVCGRKCDACPEVLVGMDSDMPAWVDPEELYTFGMTPEQRSEEAAASLDDSALVLCLECQASMDDLENIEEEDLFDGPPGTE